MTIDSSVPWTVGSLTSLFAREKSIVMGGNIVEHYRFITSLEGGRVASIARDAKFR